MKEYVLVRGTFGTVGDYVCVEWKDRGGSVILRMPVLYGVLADDETRQVLDIPEGTSVELVLRVHE